MDKDLLDSIFRLLSTFAVLFVIGYIVNQCARVNNDIALNAQNYGDDNEKKFLTIKKSIFNFYMVVCLSIVVLAGYLKILSGELFIALFVGVLVALGVKLGLDLKGDA